jgi:hypothetical protein
MMEKAHHAQRVLFHMFSLFVSETTTSLSTANNNTNVYRAHEIERQDVIMNTTIDACSNNMTTMIRISNEQMQNISLQHSAMLDRCKVTDLTNALAQASYQVQVKKQETTRRERKRH